MRKNFFDMAVNGVCPVELLVRKSGEIRLFSSEMNGSMLHLDKVSDNMLDPFEVSFPQSNSEARHHHDSGGDVDPSQ